MKNIKEFTINNIKYNINYIDDIPTVITKVYNDLNIAKGFIVNDDFSLIECYIAKRGNYFAHGETKELALRDANQKFLNNLPIKERIQSFIDKFPKLDVKYNAIDLFIWHNTITGSCEFGRRAFCKSKNINIEEDKFTIQEFIELTKNEYNGSIIIQLNDKYKQLYE